MIFLLKINSWKKRTADGAKAKHKEHENNFFERMGCVRDRIVDVKPLMNVLMIFEQHEATTTTKTFRLMKKFNLHNVVGKPDVCAA